MPDDYYVSQYSGEEIDERLTAAHNAVRYDAAQTLTNAQKQQARGNIEAAPSGFGWGNELPKLASTAAEVDAITANSIVRYANGSTNLVDGDNGSYTRYAIVVTYTVNETDKAQDVYCYGGGAHGDVMMHRGRYGNTWLPWEWVNPPMQLGVEYRTTERYQGKPVYAKRIHCESMPSGAGYIDIQPSNTEVHNALISTAIVIRCYGRSSVEATIPFYSGSGDFMQVGVVENCKIRIYTAKAYGGTADITVHYVKSTD